MKPQDGHPASSSDYLSTDSVGTMHLSRGKYLFKLEDDIL